MSSWLPQALFFRQQLRCWSFLTCVSPVEVFPAAAGAFCSAEIELAHFVSHEASLVRSSLLLQAHSFGNVILILVSFQQFRNRPPAALVFMIASAVAQANQCPGGGECPSDDMPKDVVRPYLAQLYGKFGSPAPCK